MNPIPNKSPSPDESARSTARVVVWIATAAVFLFALALAWRPVISKELGYHLAYADTFIDTGHLVSGNDFVYTGFDPDELWARGNAPPGVWIDADGNYRFPNANYASQIAMSLLYRAGGFKGLSVLQVLLVAAIVGLAWQAMERLATARAASAVGCLLIALVGYERFNLRPEMFGFVFLLAILALLCAGRFTWGGVAGLIATQWAFVQFHSYWPLGLALAGAFLVDALLRVVARRTSAHPRMRQRLLRLTVATLGMAAVAFVNPWGWRLAALPLQTVAFLQAHDISAGAMSEGSHPWATIREFRRPFEIDTLVLQSKSTYAYLVTLVLAAAGLVISIARRRWAWALILIGMGAVSLSMRRNLTPASLVLIPIVMAALTQLRPRSQSEPGGGFSTAWTRRLSIAVGLAAVAASLYWGAAVMDGRFYYEERWPWRFGAGAPAPDLPLAAARRIRDVAPSVRVFTSFNVSSSVLYFSRGKSGFHEVPILTNTWAYPALTMWENATLCSGKGDFGAFAEANGVGLVVLECARQNAPLIRSLLRDDGWKLVDFDGWNVLIARTELEFAPMALDASAVARIAARITSTEAHPAFALNRVGYALQTMGMNERAEAMWRECLARDADYFEAWNTLGALLVERALAARELQDAAGERRELLEAKFCFERALSARPGYAPARTNLNRTQKWLAE